MGLVDQGLDGQATGHRQATGQAIDGTQAGPGIGTGYRLWFADSYSVCILSMGRALSFQGFQVMTSGHDLICLLSHSLCISLWQTQALGVFLFLFARFPPHDLGT